MADNEQSPLLPRQDPESRVRRQPFLTRLSTAASIPTVHIPKAHNSSTIVTLLCIIAFIVSCSVGFLAIPFTALIEEIACRHYYNTHPINALGPVEERCRIPAVQSRMAYVFAAMEVGDAVVACIAAFPWGLIADRIGRKPVVAICLIGAAGSIVWRMIVLSFPQIFDPNMLIFECLFYLLGGGTPVLVGIILSMIADVVPKADRATAFTRVHVSSIVAILISPALAAMLTDLCGPWPVPWVAVACLMLSAILFAFVPESLPEHKRAGASPTATTSSSAPRANDDNGNDDDDTNTDGFSFRTHLKSLKAHLSASFSMLQSRHLLILISCCFLTTPMTTSTMQFLNQFAAKRYQISYSSTGYLQAANGVVQAFVALVGLPLLSRLMIRSDTSTSSSRTPKFLQRPDEQTRDLTLAKFSFAVLVINFIIMALSPVLPGFIIGFSLLGLGSPGTSLLRSMMSLYVDVEQTSRLYSLVGMVEVLGNIYGSPMLAGLFSWAMDRQEPWLGTPYLSTAFLGGLVLFALWFVRVPSQG